MRMRGKGRLTDKTIKLLTHYYGKAIRSNTGDCAAMQDAVWAGVYHSQPTDSSPQYQYLPSGQRSWYKFFRALANSEQSTPHSPTIHPDIVPPLKKVFERLSHPTLMERCLLGATQNQNESFNSTIWQHCPKRGFYSATTMEIAGQFSTNLLQLGPGSLRKTPGKVGGHCFSPHKAVPF